MCFLSPARYGLTYAGVGWAVWRSKEYLDDSLMFVSRLPLHFSITLRFGVLTIEELLPFSSCSASTSTTSVPIKRHSL
jgi:hypothetical protein